MSIINKNGIKFRELVLVDKVKECDGIISFYFKDKEGKKLTKHKPGQFLPFQIQTGDSKYSGVIRTYSLSMIPNENIYRISVKRVEGGLISTYLHDNLKIGDIIEAMEPTGIFTIKESSKHRPIVLLSAGIGVTPLLSMLYQESKNRKDIYFVQSVQNSLIQPFKYDIEYICKKHGLNNIVFYSKSLDTDKEGIDYNFKGRVNKDWIKNNLPIDADFYFCGPPQFMKSIEEGLIDLGVNKESINYELFN